MKSMKNYSNYIAKSSRISWMMAVMIFLLSCSNEEVISQNKGAVTQIMQGIAANVPYIQSVESESVYPICDGIQITDVNFTYCTKPTRMLIATIDLTKNVTLVTSTADDRDAMGVVQPIDIQAMKAENGGKKVWLGINGDFGGYYEQEGVWSSAGVFYKNGKAIKDKAAAGFDNVFCMLNDGSARLCSYTEFQEIKSNARYALGGYQRLVENGETREFDVNDISMLFHPRTFMGISKDNKTVYLFVLDGRQPAYSNGMRLDDVKLLCQGAGCYQAVNLDGGGSSIMVHRVEKNGTVSFDIMNKPSDGSSRAVVNGLLVVEKK